MVMRRTMLLAGWLYCGTLALGQKVVSPPDYSAFSQSYALKYAVAPDFSSEKLLKVRAQINGGPVGVFTVDTGSVGMIVGADEVPNIDPAAKPGQITYSSSGVQLKGVWTTATVVFPDAKSADGVATAVIPVLAVTSEACTGVGVNSDHCHPNEHPHPHMLGIGFGRGHDDSHPEKNAFLNLKEMQAGTMRRGYVITHQGIELGLTAQDVGEGFVWQKLKEKPVSAEAKAVSAGLKDWETAPGSFRVDGAQVSAGTVLMDTGLTNMILEAEGAPGKGLVAEGTPITVELLGGQLRYSFKAGDLTNPQTPRKVDWAKAARGTFVNTGLHALSAYDYLYDMDGGWLALRVLKP